MVVGEKSDKQQLTASVTTAKTTLAHSSVVKARDEAYQVRCYLKLEPLGKKMVFGVLDQVRQKL